MRAALVTGGAARAIVAAVVLLAGCAGAHRAVYVAEAAGRLELKPRSIVTGVSGGFILFDKWLGYGSDTAKARARFEINDCVPDCATGTRTDVRALVVLRPVVRCRGTSIYRTLTVIRSNDEAAIPIGDTVDLASLCHEGKGPP